MIVKRIISCKRHDGPVFLWKTSLWWKTRQHMSGLFKKNWSETFILIPAFSLGKVMRTAALELDIPIQYIVLMHCKYHCDLTILSSGLHIMPP